jgi:hypothetical protein
MTLFLYISNSRFKIIKDSLMMLLLESMISVDTVNLYQEKNDSLKIPSEALNHLI